MCPQIPWIPSTCCKGATCGSLTSVTKSLATYSVSGAVPNPASVTLTATPGNGTKNSAADLFLMPPSNALAI